jgi:hypothetical protein
MRNRQSVRGITIVLFLVISTLGCSKRQLGLPRVPLSSTSPDGRFVAQVHNHLSVDPPDQSIWIGSPHGTLRQIEHLGPDSDWCNTIVWSADSSTVAYLIQDARLRVVRAGSSATVFNNWIVERRGEYPPQLQVKDLTLSPDGKEATYRACQRSNGECSNLQTIDVSGEANGAPA